jgi:hypothetical protein
MVGSLATGRVLGQAYHQFIDGTVSRVPEPNCGLVTDSLQPKTVYHAYQNLISLLGSVVLASRLDVSQPLTGYEFESEEGARVLVFWSSGETEVDLTEILGPGSPTFLDMVGGSLEAPPDRVPVGPSPIYAVTGPLGMADVPQDHWAYESILACLDAGIVAGYPDGTYHPSDAVTRDLWGFCSAPAAAGGDDRVPTGPAEASFPDVPIAHWAHRYVEFVRQADIVSGYPDGLYRPDDIVDRGQMAAFIARSLLDADTAVLDVPGDPTFPDVTPDGDWSWCYPHVEYLVRQGIVHGYRDGCYHPDHICSRDQMAVYIARAFRLLS